MTYRVALQYPNGRTHEATLDHVRTPTLGFQFEMYGRSWRVTELDNRDGSRLRRLVNPADELTRYVCVSVVDL